MRTRSPGHTPCESVQATPAAIRAALGRVRARLVWALGPGERAETIELVLAEVFNNIAEHAFGESGEGELSFDLRLSEDGVVIEVRDSGLALPAWLASDDTAPDLLLPLQPEEGGYGWFLIRTLADEVRYERRDGINCLRLTFAQSVHA